MFLRVSFFCVVTRTVQRPFNFVLAEENSGLLFFKERIPARNTGDRDCRIGSIEGKGEELSKRHNFSPEKCLPVDENQTKKASVGAMQAFCPWRLEETWTSVVLCEARPRRIRSHAVRSFANRSVQSSADKTEKLLEQQARNGTAELRKSTALNSFRVSFILNQN